LPIWSAGRLPWRASASRSRPRSPSASTSCSCASRARPKPLYNRSLMFEIGNSLREARVRQGLDYPQVELATKIRAKYIRALEEEQFELLPTGTYIKGFLRSYAE